uniref:Uncharacterized protein n=1 Tax=Myripristis murdjan TaxID=586833 RepID=A0A667ZKB7_9TELE
MAEDHGLGNGKASIKVTECCELVLLVVARRIELLDGVHCLLLTLQLDDIWVRNNPLCKLPHRVLKSCREKKHLAVLCPPLDANALVLMTLCGYHDISLIQHKHSDLLWVDKLQLCAPKKHRCTLSYYINYGHPVLTFIAANGICQFHFRIKFSHLLNYLSNLHSKLVCR